MIVNAGYRGKVGAAAPKFTYTGQYNIRKDGVVELLTSGTIVFLEPKVIDVFMVGGGGGGGYQGAAGKKGSGGGGGGYTRTVRRVNVIDNRNYQIQVGAGGLVNNGKGQNGSASAFDSYTAPGGNSGLNTTSFTGGVGGSGGGGGVSSNSNYGVGGSNGNGGESGYPTSQAGGKGQGFTTREFGEAAGKLYAGGGGGGRYMVASSPVISMGGTGGGGAGGWCSDNDYQPATAGVTNTGGGGGGGVRVSTSNYTEAASGGSGIVCFRDAQELPELAGTWVLNERLYTSENNVSVYTSFTGKKENTQTQKSFTAMNVDANAVTAKLAGSSTITLYTFSNNAWDQKYKIITFPAGATASDEFRAWLASNATKQ